MTNFSLLCNACFQYDRNTLSLEEITEKFSKWYVLGYEVWQDGQIKGWSYALKVNGIYTLDGINNGVSVFSASRAGKMVAKALFKDHTDFIITGHDVDQKELDILAKRVGFKHLLNYEDRTLFYMRKS